MWCWGRDCQPSTEPGAFPPASSWSLLVLPCPWQLPKMTPTPSTQQLPTPHALAPLFPLPGAPFLLAWPELSHPSALSPYFSYCPALFCRFLWASPLPAGSPIPFLITLSPLLLPLSGLPDEIGTSQGRDCWRLGHWSRGPQGEGGPGSGPALMLLGARARPVPIHQMRKSEAHPVGPQPG